MFLVLLRFANNKDNAGEHAAGHAEWIARGFDDGVFLMVGSLQPNLGGAILAHNTTRAAIEARVGQDPFVAEGVVTAEILQITPNRADKRLEFLLG